MQMRFNERTERLKVKVADSRTLEKISRGGKVVLGAIAEGSGFVAWSLGNLVSPIMRKVRANYEEYQTHGPSEKDEPLKDDD